MNINMVVDNQSSRILAFLIRNAKEFVPPLEQRVDLISYAQKLATYAHNIFAVKGQNDVGHAAVYTNDLKLNVAFLSSICIDSSCRGQGLARQLLLEVIKSCTIKGMVTLKLEVDTQNKAALDFYRQSGFEVDIKLGERTLMILPITDGNGEIV